jgi:hypothetical protein
MAKLRAKNLAAGLQEAPRDKQIFFQVGLYAGLGNYLSQEGLRSADSQPEVLTDLQAAIGHNLGTLVRIGEIRQSLRQWSAELLLREEGESRQN